MPTVDRRVKLPISRLRERGGRHQEARFTLRSNRWSRNALPSLIDDHFDELKLALPMRVRQARPNGRPDLLTSCADAMRGRRRPSELDLEVFAAAVADGPAGGTGSRIE